MSDTQHPDTSASHPARIRPRTVALSYLLACAAPLISVVLYAHATSAAGVDAGFPLDDSWIHAQYARTLIEGRPFQYVQGQPSMGTTSVLFDIVWAAATGLTGEYVYTIYTVNIALTCALAAVLVALLRRFNVPPLTAGVGAALIVTTYPFPWSNLSGMETALAAFLTMAAILAHVTTRDKTGWRPLTGPILMALAAMARPENMVLYPLSEIDRLISRFRQVPENRLPHTGRRLAIRMAAFALALLPYFALNFAITGQPVPNTYQAKVGGLALGADLQTGGLAVLANRIRVSLGITVDSFRFLAWHDNLILLILAVPGLTVLLKRRPRSPGAASLFPLLVPLGGVAAVGLVTLGLFFPGQEQRYLIQWIPPVFLYGVVGIHLLARKAADLIPAAPRAAYASVVSAAVVANLLFMASLYPEQVRRYVTSVKNINEMQVALGRWAAEHTPPDAVIATNDIGAIAFFSHRPIVDTIGLIDPKIIRIRHAPEPTRAMLDYLKQRGASYAMLFPTWHPDLILDEHFIPLRRVLLDDNVICGDRRMLVGRLDWNGSRNGQPLADWAREELDFCQTWVKLKFLQP